MQRWSASSLPSSPVGYCQLHAVSISYSHLCRASLAEEDEFISKPAQTAIKRALANKPNATVYSYAGQRHAFSRNNGAHYNAAAAALANGRTHEFLGQQLRSLAA
jgi:dienelactone hydrolase